MSSHHRNPRSDSAPNFRRADPRSRTETTAEESDRLRIVLQRQPEVRPEVVARARILAADPSYPPLAVIRHIAVRVLAAPDLSEEIT